MTLTQHCLDVPCLLGYVHWLDVGPRYQTTDQHWYTGAAAMRHRVSVSTATGSMHVFQQTRGVDPMLFYCWTDVEDVGSTIKQHRVNGSCLLWCQVVMQTVTTRCRCCLPAFPEASTILWQMINDEPGAFVTRSPGVSPLRSRNPSEHKTEAQL